MDYLLMIFEDESARAQLPADVLTPQYGAFTQSIVQSGAMKDGQRLKPSSTATTVRVRDGQAVHTDGPFAETKELLGGYYLIDVPDLDAALAWAAKIPLAPYGSVEVRPVMDLPADMG